MRARRFARRAAGLLSFAVTLAATTPALGHVVSSVTPATQQAVGTGTWRLVFSTSEVPASPSGTVQAVENTTSYLWLVNTGTRAIPASHTVAVTVTSTDGAPMTLTACVGGTWTSATTCSGTQKEIGTTSGLTRFVAGTVLPVGTAAVPPGHAVQVRVSNTSLLSGTYTGRATPSVSLTWT